MANTLIGDEKKCEYVFNPACSKAESSALLTEAPGWHIEHHTSVWHYQVSKVLPLGFQHRIARYRPIV
jgi:hypothetical protein